MKKHIAQTYDSSGPDSTTFVVVIILQVCCQQVLIIGKDDAAQRASGAYHPIRSEFTSS
jgi:hypothetical protein